MDIAMPVKFEHEEKLILPKFDTSRRGVINSNFGGGGAAKHTA